MTEPPADDRCDFCRGSLPPDPVATTYEDATYSFCTAACRDAMVESGRVFTADRDHRRFRTGVTAVDDSLPEGVPRNSFVLLLGQPGAREEAIGAELVWRALERGEPAVVVAFTEPPTSVVENFLAMDWNVLPYLEDGQLAVLDCFTYRLDDRDQLYDRMTAWNRHLHRITEPRTNAVRDPSDRHELQNAIDNCLEELDMVETGIVVVDSLAEFGSLVQPVQAYDFVRSVRADVCKGRFVPVVAGATVGGDDAAFPRDLDYVADGVIDLWLDGNIVDDTLLRRLRVRKMRGVLTVSESRTYEYTSGLGLVTFDPLEEIDGQDREADGPTDAAAGTDADRSRSTTDDVGSAGPTVAGTGDGTGPETGERNVDESGTSEADPGESDAEESDANDRE